MAGWCGCRGWAGHQVTPRSTARYYTGAELASGQTPRSAARSIASIGARVVYPTTWRVGGEVGVHSGLVIVQALSAGGHIYGSQPLPVSVCTAPDVPEDKTPRSELLDCVFHPPAPILPVLVPPSGARGPRYAFRRDVLQLLLFSKFPRSAVKFLDWSGNRLCRCGPGPVGCNSPPRLVWPRAASS